MKFDKFLWNTKYSIEGRQVGRESCFLSWKSTCSRGGLFFFFQVLKWNSLVVHPAASTMSGCTPGKDFYMFRVGNYRGCPGNGIQNLAYREIVLQNATLFHNSANFLKALSKKLGKFQF